MITARELVQRLTRRDPGAWSVVERVQDVATVDDLAFQRTDHRTRLAVIVHRDVPRGRGSARIDVDAFDGSAANLIDQAIALALTAVGPSWPSTPPAAPAKVAVLDDDLATRDLDTAARSILTRLRRPAGVTTTATLEILREQITVTASSGFRTTWLATSLRADAVLALGPHRVTFTRTARRVADLDLDAALADAAADLLQLSAARAPAPGPCTLWLGPDALLHGGDLGLWSIFDHQADAAIERQGLTRYRLRAEIAPGAAQVTEPLSITSDGALDFATHSAPITDDAVAIRRFPLVERGIAVGLGLSPREAALRRTDPNGGIRNLVVSPGTWSPLAAAPTSATTPSSGAAVRPPNAPTISAANVPTISAANAPTISAANDPTISAPNVPAISAPGAPLIAPHGRILEVRRLHALSIDLYTGEATLDIAFALEHRASVPAATSTPIPITGGSIRLDLLPALARARRSSQLLRRGPYHGPVALLIDDADLLA